MVYLAATIIVFSFGFAFVASLTRAVVGTVVNKACGIGADGMTDEQRTRYNEFIAARNAKFKAACDKANAEIAAEKIMAKYNAAKGE